MARKQMAVMPKTKKQAAKDQASMMDMMYSKPAPKRMRKKTKKAAKKGY